ncbi:hypothetical protein RUM44_004776 [Polyplax serrata]|uniref:Uncharacterized protein n=1 Tax=Polyplax serrata TaxID=468196 RepID=A0ABR1B4A0_POLSC
MYYDKDEDIQSTHIDPQNKERTDEREAEDEGDKFYWKNNGEYLMYFIIYVMDWNILGVIENEDGIVADKHGDKS